jgi:hypothetical protein
MLAAFIFVLGGKASTNDFFIMIGVDTYVSVIMICCGFFLLVTASIGCTAAASKNECLAFLVILTEHIIANVL